MLKQDAIRYFGGVRALSRALEAAGWPATPSAISQWARTNEVGEVVVPEVVARRLHADVLSPEGRVELPLRPFDYQRFAEENDA